MSQWEKLLDKVYNLSTDLRFNELRRILETYGYTTHIPSGGSSHYTFRKKGCKPITIPRHQNIKKAYIELVREAIEQEENYEKGN